MLSKYLPDIDWQQFHSFLLQRMTSKTAEDRIRYAKQYSHVLTFPSAHGKPGRPSDLLQLAPNKRIHIMKALSCLAIFTGQIDQWQQMRRQYRLSWSTGTEKIDAFTRFFDSSKTLDTMIGWLRDALHVLPAKHGNFMLFCTLTGMRGTEAVESIRLLNRVSILTLPYYNPETHTLQHFRFPQKFLRRTKSLYISFVNEQMIGLAKEVGPYPSLIGLKKALKVRSLSMQVKYCRKIFASWLSARGIQSEIIDMIQGRVSPSVFSRHYLVPSQGLKDRILQATEELARQLL